MSAGGYSSLIAEMPRDAEAEPAHPSVILIVDDDKEVREIVAEFLSDFGYQVLAAKGGREAIHLMERNPEVELLITDVRMPDMSGIELADTVAQTRPHVRIILISGYFISRAVGWRILRKPFRMQELQQAVRDELRH
jgi:CheY-like chemotaxis protein